MSPVVITNTLKSTCMHASGLKCGPWGSISVTLQISYISIDLRKYTFQKTIQFSKKQKSQNSRDIFSRCALIILHFVSPCRWSISMKPSPCFSLILCPLLLQERSAIFFFGKRKLYCYSVVNLTTNTNFSVHNNKKSTIDMKILFPDMKIKYTTSPIIHLEKRIS